MLKKLFIEFFKIGAFTLGGGYAMISLVKNALVEKHKLLKDDEFDECITIAQTLPGVLAINMALYTGQKIGGYKAGYIAALGAMIPSLIIITVIAMFFSNFQENPIVKDIFAGIKPCVMALILAPGIQIAIKGIKKFNQKILPIILCIISVILVWYFNFSVIYVIILTIIFSIIRSYLNTKKLSK